MQVASRLCCNGTAARGPALLPSSSALSARVVLPCLRPPPSGCARHSSYRCAGSLSGSFHPSLSRASLGLSARAVAGLLPALDGHASPPRWKGALASGHSAFSSGARRSRGAAKTVDHYELLGVDRDATQQEIKRAYLKEAKTCHPDVSSSPDATERFQELASAYNTLGDPGRRADYDRLGHAGYEQASQHPSQEPGFTPAADVDPARVFRSVVEELGIEQYIDHLATVKDDALEAAASAKAGDMGPAKEFAMRNKGLIAAVVLPTVAILRFPGIVAMALRVILLGAGVVLQSPAVRELIARTAWFKWRLFVRRVAARSRRQ